MQLGILTQGKNLHLTKYPTGLPGCLIKLLKRFSILSVLSFNLFTFQPFAPEKRPVRTQKRASKPDAP